jgi:hypothetical protein
MPDCLAGGGFGVAGTFTPDVLAASMIVGGFVGMLLVVSAAGRLGGVR